MVDGWQPVEMQSQLTREQLPHPWVQEFTPDGQAYYVNHETRTTQWERPDHFAPQPSQPAQPALYNTASIRSIYPASDAMVRPDATSTLMNSSLPANDVFTPPGGMQQDQGQHGRYSTRCSDVSAAVAEHGERLFVVLSLLCV